MAIENLEKRRTIKIQDIFILILILAACFGFYFFYTNRNKETGTIAQITYDGKVVLTIDLATADDKVFTLQENSKVHFEIKDHQIRFVNTDCPDKLCENVGFISHQNEVAICMPNKTALKIVGETNDFDIIAN